MIIDIEPAFSLTDLLCCGMIRNACRDYMTEDASEVTYDQQEQILIAWKEGWVLHLMKVDGVPCGMGLSRSWQGILTGCLVKSYRGLGLGEILFRYLEKQVKHSDYLVLDVLKTNERARRLYEKLGYVVEGSDEGRVIRMKKVRAV